MDSKQESTVVLNKPYMKLMGYIETIESIDSLEWTIMHSLAYICHEYKKKFGMDFVLSYDGIPSKCHEYRLTARIWNMLQAKLGHGAKVKDYIDWFYINYNGKKRFTSIGALSKADLVNKFNGFLIEKEKITMNTRLPDRYIKLLLENSKTSYVSTYGDLYFLMESMWKSKKDDFVKLKSGLISIGFDIDRLKEIS